MDYLKKFDALISVKDDSEENKDLLRANKDLKPTPPKERTWRLYNYILIWFQSSFNVNEWNTGASLIKTSGLPYGEVLGAGIFQYSLVVLLLSLMHVRDRTIILDIRRWQDQHLEFVLDILWSLFECHGPGKWEVGEKDPATVSKGNLWLSVLNSIMGTVSPMIINQPDISRYAKRPKDTVIPQAIGYLPSKIMVFMFGIVSVCSLYRAYGAAYWNIWDLFNAILDNEWGPGARTGIFFVSLAFAVGNAGTNIFANSIPFACDLAGILPKYFTIVRAQIFVGLFAWAIVPWKFLQNAQKFLTFLGSYSIFVGPLLGCLLADFYVLRKGNLHVPSLYTKNPSGVYYFVKGFNFLGLFSWAASVTIAVPGLYRAYYPDSLSQNATNIYTSGWLYTFLMAFCLHSVLGLIFKPKLYPDAHKDEPKTWEYMVHTDGFFEDDSPINGVGYPGTVELEGSGATNSFIMVEKNETKTSVISVST
ncbi:hypothetical protein HII13_001902 [Brettanomyces bruxellensis]|nr:hypothetical protein HII13_001902 [Brettanomyces bruxellensis]